MYHMQPLSSSSCRWHRRTDNPPTPTCMMCLHPLPTVSHAPHGSAAVTAVATASSNIPPPDLSQHAVLAHLVGPASPTHYMHTTPPTAAVHAVATAASKPGQSPINPNMHDLPTSFGRHRPRTTYNHCPHPHCDGASNLAPPISPTSRMFIPPLTTFSHASHETADVTLVVTAREN